MGKSYTVVRAINITRSINDILVTALILIYIDWVLLEIACHVWMHYSALSNLLQGQR
jgi:hypothetical protein